MTTNEHNESKQKRDDLTGTNGPVKTPGLESAGGYGRAPTRRSANASDATSATQRQRDTADSAANGERQSTSDGSAARPGGRRILEAHAKNNAG